jgi:hypothetical protein
LLGSKLKRSLPFSSRSVFGIFSSDECLDQMRVGRFDPLNRVGGDNRW